jgi:hypothetical protein
MKSITEYKTITADSFNELDKKVNESISQGFQPFVNPYVTDAGEFLACQAMVQSSN